MCRLRCVPSTAARCIARSFKACGNSPARYRVAVDDCTSKRGALLGLSMYCVFKDFAGPIATIIASLTAAFFVYRQWQTAEKQAETALDQLRYNLFSKRFAIYEDIKQLLKLLINDADKLDFSDFAAAQHFVVIDEAIFFFSPATCAWLDSLKTDCQNFLEAHALRMNLDEHKPMEYAALQTKLVAHFRAMPERFREELSFRQLTRPPSL